MCNVSNQQSVVAVNRPPSCWLLALCPTYHKIHVRCQRVQPSELKSPLKMLPCAGGRGCTPEGSSISPLLLMKARIQYQQREETEQKLFNMLEQRNNNNLPRGTAGLNQRSNSNSASSNVSLASSVGSSLASSLGSTGSGAGKVRQMFEERRNLNATLTGPNAFGRPPKNPARNSPTKGYDKSYPLDPIAGDKKVNTFGWNRPPKSKAAGFVSPSGESYGSSELRRTKSQYQIETGGGGGGGGGGGDEILESRQPNKVQSMNNLSDAVATVNGRTKLPSNRFGYATPQNSPSNLKLSHGVNGVELDEAAMEWLRRQADEKKEIEERARLREEQLLNTIRQQQMELDRLRLAAAAAETKNKTSIGTAKPSVQNNRQVATRSSSSSLEDSEDIKSPTERNFYKNKVPAAVPVPPKPKPTIAPRPRPAPPRPAPSETLPKPKKPVLALKPPANPPAPAKRAPRRQEDKNIPKSLPKESPPTSAERAPRAPPADGLEACSNCGRYFAVDRLEKHEAICQKTSQKKRKVFDVTKMRVQGTEAESYVMPVTVKKGGKSAVRPPKEEQAPQQGAGTGNKPDWRKKRESFLEAMRQAKMVQKHLAAGGNLADLPPPPPSDTSDYIQCPHCTRRFAPGAAERHIPKCANIKSNKR